MDDRGGAGCDPVFGGADSRRGKALRLLAWQHTPGASDPYTYTEAWDCSALCQDHRGTWQDGQRTRLGCTRTDLPAVEWDVDVAALAAAYTGRHQRDADGVTVWRHLHRAIVRRDRPPEDPAEGCPGGWYRTAFADSVIPYLRARCEGGARVPNHRLDSCGRRLVHDAVLYYEQEQERVHGLQAELIAARRTAK